VRAVPEAECRDANGEQPLADPWQLGAELGLISPVWRRHRSRAEAARSLGASA
jgi:hypothetical protein